MDYTELTTEELIERFRSFMKNKSFFDKIKASCFYPKFQQILSDTCDRIGTIGTIPNDVKKEYSWESSIKAIGNNPEHVDIVLADCLRRETACVDVDFETMEWKKFYIKDSNLNIVW